MMKRPRPILNLSMGLLLARAAFLPLMLAGCQSAATPESAQPTPETTTYTDGPVTVRVGVDTSTATVGEPITLTVEASCPPGVTVAIPEPTKLPAGLDVTDPQYTRDVPSADGRSRLWTRRATIEPIDTGAFELPAMTIAYTDSRTTPKRTGQVTTKPVSLKIASVLTGQVDPTQFRDIKGRVDLPAARTVRWGLWMALLGGLTIAVGGVGVGVFVKKRLDRRPETLARKALDRLEHKGLLDDGQFDVFYTQLTTIVRIYLERRYRLSAPTQTTREFLHDVHAREDLPTERREALGAFLTAADMVKFAMLQPTDEQARDAIATARTFIDTAATDTASRDGKGKVAA